MSRQCVQRRSGGTGVIRRLLACAASAACIAGSGIGAPETEMLIRAPEPSPPHYLADIGFDERIPTPRSVIGHEIGERFTRYPDVLAYVRALADASDRVRLREYGRSHLGRPLVILTISSPKNLARLDSILEANRELADPATSESRASEIARTNPAIVWLSYNVHGNEPSCTETALRLSHLLAAGRSARLDEILDSLVIVIDPCLNPDGRERYINWYENVMGAAPIADPNAAEHDEPWPGGRTNHYYFDLNRDWLWLIHPESRSRIRVYREYLPQLHVDYHEQEYTAPHFFGAGDSPYNANIPQESRDWLDLYGRALAASFDARGLIYATKERFDYLYPGYGKVTPCYYGAIGMLCEQGGHSRAGLTISVTDTYDLTLAERADNHFITSMTYLDVTADKRREQLERFRRFFTESMVVPEGSPTAFILHAGNDLGKLRRVWELCSEHGIRIETLDADGPVAGLRNGLLGEEAADPTVRAGSWVIRTDQPMGRYARAIFERDPALENKDTYDITSWSLPIMFGLDAGYTELALTNATTPLTEGPRPRGALTGEGSVAVLVDSEQSAFPRAVGAAMRHKLTARYTGEPVEIDGKRFGMGSLVVHVIRNDIDALNGFVREALDAGADVHRTATAWTEDGHVLGANAHRRFRLPRVLLLRGEPMNNLSFGQHWHLLDVEARLPYTPVVASRLASMDLNGYDVLVLADGGDLARELGERGVNRLKTWVQAGGVIVATGRIAEWANESIAGVERKKEEDGRESKTIGNIPHAALSFEARRLERIDRRVPGALVLVSIDPNHPLSAGTGTWIGSIKRNDRTLDVADSGWVVGRYGQQAWQFGADTDAPGLPLEGRKGRARIGGSISHLNESRLLMQPFMTHHRVGSGGVIGLADDVTIRGMNHAGMRLLLNAIIYGPSL